MEWLRDDPELLNATLEILEGWDCSSTNRDSISVESLEPSADPQNSQAAAVASFSAAKPSKTFNTSRAKRRQELLYLRTRVAEMEQQLQQLQQRREEMLRPHFNSQNEGELVTVAPVWEQLATRQFQARKKAELLNTKLKGMLAARVRIVQGLIRSIELASEQSQDDAAVLAPRPVIAIDVSQRMSEEEQLLRLEATCANWQNMFESCESFQKGATAPLKFLDTRIVQDSETETVLDMFSSSAVPFPNRLVNEALWGLFLEDIADDEGNSFAQDCRSTDNHIIASFTSTTKVDPDLRFVMHGKYISRRFYHNATQPVVVTHLISEPESRSHEILQGVALHEESWVRLMDAHEFGYTHLAAPLTVIQHVHRLRIRFEDGTTPTRVETLTNLFRNQVRKEYEWMEQLVENVLVRRATKSEE